MVRILSFSLLVLLTFCVHLITPTTADARDEEACNTKSACQGCIQTRGCKWCKDEEFKKPRCFYEKSNSTCNDVENPKSEEFKNDGNKIETSINPYNGSIKLRPGEKRNITIVYTDEKNRPLDLYILMDLSCTMSKHKESVAKLSQELVNALKNLTNNLKIGFGSFVDKPVRPYVFLSDKENATQKCNGKEVKFIAHLYKNHLPMTNNYTQFKKTVEETEILSNIDSPEGGLDALMQAISCKGMEQKPSLGSVGWNKDNGTRRLVVLSTDGPFHISGDGKLAGIIRPNDGKCHMDEKGEHSEPAKFDYPSISQIRDKIVQENVFVVFTVPKYQAPKYQQLVNSIGPEFSSVGTIGDKESIVKTITKEFEKVLTKVNLGKHESDSDIDVKYYVQCPNEKDYKPGSGCGNLTPGAKVKFQVEIGFKSCPTDKKWKSIVEIVPVGGSKGEENRLKIKLEMLCSCNCDSTSTSTDKSRCSNQGSLKCGVCSCDEGYGGQKCSCPIKEGHNIDIDQCKNNQSEICGNKGDCSCGECTCNPEFYGKFCECNDNLCYKSAEDKGLCNVEDGHGKCNCGQCKCNAPFTGPRCECRNDCQDPNSNSIKTCNGNGNCECDNCVCKEGYTGRYCELKKPKENFACKKDIADEMARCARCLAIDKADIEDEKNKISLCNSCRKVDVTLAEEIEGTDVSSDDCKESLMDANGCNIFFIIGTENIHTKRISIRTERKALKKNCPPPPVIIPVILGVIGAIVLIGILLLLIWKVTCYIHDKREYQKFEKETDAANWNLNQNPLYKATTTSFQNPSYSTDQ